MLNQHRHLAVPLSDWLKIGDCVLDLPRREIACPQRAQPLRITVKAQQVLMALVSQHGKVVSREALIEWVWPDTLPTDDVLTQAIAQLRKAFCEDRDAPRYLETIAKGGYRLLAPLQWLEGPEGEALAQSAPTAAQIEPATAVAPVAAETAAPAPLPPPQARGAYVWGALAALIAVAAIGAGWFARDRPEKTTAAKSAAPTLAERTGMAKVPLEYRRITSSPDNEAWPSVSPDGSQVVYSVYKRDSATLMVQTTSPVPARALTTIVPGRSDVMAAWSPDGRQLLFMRVESDSACKLMLMPSSGGDARPLADCVPNPMTTTYSWHPDARHIVARGMRTAAGDAATIQVLDLATGNWERLNYAHGERDIDTSPAYSPDGKWIAFQRNFSLADLWRMPAAGGRPQRLTHMKLNIYGFAWTPDSRRIVFSGYRSSGPNLLAVDVDDGQLLDLTVPGYDVTAPSIALKASSLAFMLSKSTSALYSLPLRPGAEAAPAPAFASTGTDMLPAVSPDGRQIAFYSDRSAQLGLWLGELGRPESLRWIEGFLPLPRYAPVWSADSRRMLVIGQDDGRSSLYEVVPGNGQVRKLAVPLESPIRADYLPDPDRLLVVADQGAGRLGLTLYDRRATPWRVLATIDDVVYASVDAAHGRVVFTRPQQSGLWQADLELRDIKALAKRPAPGAPSSRRLVVKRDGVWLAAADERCGLLWIGLEGQAPPRCLHKGDLGQTSVTYDGARDRLYFSSEREQSPDIGWAPLPAAKPR
jgi:Tol biopolymer transport system component/DNA-binding winged helix-turn-helix (wHTH) protein